MYLDYYMNPETDRDNKNWQHISRIIKFACFCFGHVKFPADFLEKKIIGVHEFSAIFDDYIWWILQFIHLFSQQICSGTISINISQKSIDVGMIFWRHINTVQFYYLSTLAKCDRKSTYHRNFSQARGILGKIQIKDKCSGCWCDRFNWSSINISAGTPLKQQSETRKEKAVLLAFNIYWMSTYHAPMMIENSKQELAWRYEESIRMDKADILLSNFLFNFWRWLTSKIYSWITAWTTIQQSIWNNIPHKSFQPLL